jgi:hypothetical protein
MTELTPYTPPQSPTGLQQQGLMYDQAMARLETWARTAIAAQQVAEMLVKTSFVPLAFQEGPEKYTAHEATAAILAGAEVGLSPLASLKSFDPINGVSAPRALTLRAIVQSQGHQVWVKESTTSRAVVCGQRRGSDKVEESRWTMERAKDLGLTNRDQWKRQPQNMLVARATAEVCRLVAADAILGIGYTVEELTDEPGTTGTPGTVETQPATRRMSRKKPALPDAVERFNERLPDPPEPITDAQVTKLHASFGDLGITDRDQKLAYATKVLDHPIDSSRDLTKAEAMRVIDALEADITAAVPSLNQPEETP